VDRLRHDIPPRDAVTSQLVRYYFPGFANVNSQQPLEEPPCGLAIPASLEKHVRYFTVLIDCPPEILLLYDVSTSSS
jgi:hypothetical protein